MIRIRGGSHTLELVNGEERMTRLSVLAVATAALFCLAVPANAQALKDQVLGTWTLVSNVQKYQDGKEENDFGPKGKGLLILDRTGWFSLQIIGGDRAKQTGRPVNPIGPAITYFGTYTVGEGDKSLVYKVQGSTYPNFEGTEQKATITIINADDMTYVRAPIAGPQGSFVPTLTWKRAK